jgi:hypothetical protein
MFDHFLYFGTEGPDLADVAPHLAWRMYENKARTVMTFSLQEQAEVDELLAWAEREPPSSGLVPRRPKKCMARRSTHC